MKAQAIHREFAAFGLVVQRDALMYLQEILKSTKDPENLLQAILQSVTSISTDSLISKSMIEDVFKSIRRSEKPTHHIFGFQDAFEMPKIAFDSTGRNMIFVEKPKSIIGDANDKLNVYLERYQILKTCLLHIPLFQASKFSFSIGSNKSLSITTTASLLSLEDSSVIILGFIDSDGGQIMIEDTTGVVPLNISNTNPANGIFANGSIVLVQGDYHDNTVFCSLIGHPPAIDYDSFTQLFWKLPSDPFGWGLKNDAISELEELLESEHSDSLILFFSDIWCDVPSVLDGFNYALSQYDQSPPNIIVICGSFISQSIAFDQYQKFTKHFAKFSDIIKSHKTIYDNTQIVIVPSLNDIGSPHVFPRTPFPTVFSSMLPNAHFMSNPCRIRFLNQTITIFRDDLLKRFSNAHILPVPESESYKNMLTTILDQRHLCPVDLDHSPILWPYDYTMRLFPPPDVLAICDSCPSWTEKYTGCCSFNPGQFGNDGTFIQYFPFSKTAEITTLQ